MINLKKTIALLLTSVALTITAVPIQKISVHAENPDFFTDSRTLKGIAWTNGDFSPGRSETVCPISGTYYNKKNSNGKMIISPDGDVYMKNFQLDDNDIEYTGKTKVAYVCNTSQTDSTYEIFFNAENYWDKIARENKPIAIRDLTAKQIKENGVYEVLQWALVKNDGSITLQGNSFMESIKGTKPFTRKKSFNSEAIDLVPGNYYHGCEYGKNVVDITDLSYLCLYCVDKKQQVGTSLMNGDLNFDGVVNTTDTSILMQRLRKTGYTTSDEIIMAYIDNIKK